MNYASIEDSFPTNEQRNTISVTLIFTDTANMNKP